MFELTIGGNVYGFKFGIGFVREVNKRQVREQNGLKQEIGLQVLVASLVDGDILALIDALDIANKGQDLRITRMALESYIEDEETDIDKLFADVLDFLKQNNATRKATTQALAIIEEQMKRR